MKRNNPSPFFVKAVFACIVLLFTAKTAFAQITLDLGVLADEFPVKEEKKPAANEPKEKIRLENPEKETVKKPVPPQKAVPAQKPVVKNNPPKQKKNVKPKEKYKVTESAAKDEHDKLKPHAAPVPDVKVLSAKSLAAVPEKQEQPDQTDQQKTAPEIPSELNEPKLSKHFLEKQQEKKTEASVLNDTPPVALVSKRTSDETRKKEGAETSKTNITETKSFPSILNFSVFPVFEKLTAVERSALLAKELPEDSATVKVLNDKKLLTQILIFEKKSAELTDEMRNVLNETATLMKKDKQKRLVLYSYCPNDPAEPGKEWQYALRRALIIRSYLTSQGVLSLRIELRVQGSKGAERIPDRTDLVLSDR